MKKIIYVFIVAILFATSCTEPAYYMENAEQYPAIASFPAEYQGVYVQNAESLTVYKNTFAIVSTNEDIPKSGQLGADCMLKKHGAYQVVYFQYGSSNPGFYRLRFFSLANKVLTVKKIKEDTKSVDEIKGMALFHKVEADADGLGSDQHFFKINGAILDKLIAQYLEVEYTLPKVK